MVLRKEVLQRLLLAKSILAPARTASQGQPNEHIVARQVLNAHDAADLVFAAIADQQGKLPSKGPSPAMLGCLDLIESEAEKHSGYFKQLNDARNGLKHVGNLPNTKQWASVADDVFDKLSSICDATLHISLEGMDESELLQHEEAKTYLLSAKAAKADGNFKLALEEIAKALSVSLFFEPGLNIDVGEAKAEDALKLSGFGVSANDFLRLQEFLPKASIEIMEGPEQIKISWKQSGFGHPGNWNEDVVNFCISTYVNLALGIENTPTGPYPMPFEFLYEYKITAEQDNVEIWDDLIDEPLAELSAYSEDDPSSRPFRGFVRYLAKGESVTLLGSTRPLISEDRALDGKPIKRVQITNNDFSAIAPHAKAEFVNRAQVRITCAPSALAAVINEAFSNLPEIPYEEDQPS